MEPVTLGAPVVIAVFKSAVHLELTHPSDLLESRAVTDALRASGRAWCKRNGQRFRSGYVSGWTLGRSSSQTRMICLIGEDEQ